MIKDFVRKYKYSIVVPLFIILVITIILILTSSGPQKGAFRYQVF